MITRDYPQIPIILDRKHHKTKNIVVGSNDLQIDFLVRELTLVNGEQKISHVDKVRDEDAYKIKDNSIIILEKDDIELSEDLLSKIGVWSNKPITKRSAAINSIVRYASSLVGKQLDKKAIEVVGDFIVYKDRDDIECIIYDVAWKLLDTRFYHKRFNLWDKPLEWIQSGEDIDSRLNYLYQELSWYVLSQTDEWVKAKSTGCSASKFKWFKSCKFDNYVVSESIKILSLWKAGVNDQYKTLIKLGAIWL